MLVRQVQKRVQATGVAVGAVENERMAANVSGFDRNDDELRKTAASRAYQDGAYPFELF